MSRLILVRHAKTQERSLALPDKERQLTLAGRRSIEARFPITLQLLSDVDIDDVKVWSSPALRALQTAEVVASALDIGGIEVKESLYDGSADDLMAELADESGTVIVVGHNPFMEELYQRLCSAMQDMKPGAMASFAFAPSDGGDAVAASWLEWFVQAPRVGRWQTIVDVEDACVRAADRIERCAADLADNPDDPESLHQYRISLRVARSLLLFLRPYCKRAPVKKALRALKELQDPTSRIRELDMLLDALGPQAPESPLVREICAAKREAFVNWLMQPKAAKAIARIAKRVAKVPWLRQVGQCGLEAHELAARASKMRAEYEVHMAQVNYDDREAVHDVRKEAKALRYVTRELADCLPDHVGDMSVRAKVVQDRLGELCDCWNNAQLVIESCGSEAVRTASGFVIRANRIVDDLKTGRAHGLSISDS